MKWSTKQQHLTYGHVAEGIREIGILWLAFSLLDRLVTNQLTFPWALTNLITAVAIWVLGIYIDVVRHG